MKKLAEKLKDSPDKEVAQLATEFLALDAEYQQLRHKYVMAVADEITKKHYNLFKRLAENGL